MSKIDCLMCHGEDCTDYCTPGGYFDRTEETYYPLEHSKEGPLGKGAGSGDAPAHANTFNLSPDYQMLKKTRTKRRSSQNAVVVAYLGDMPFFMLRVYPESGSYVSL